VLVDGIVVAEAAAWVLRPDLSSAGIGDGRHGFDVPVALDLDRLNDNRVVVRVKDGAPLPGSLVPADAAIDSVPTEGALATFVTNVLNPSPRRSDDATLVSGSVLPPFLHEAPPVQFQPRSNAPMNFIVYSATTAESLATDIGGPEYSYYFVARAFNPLLARLGTVHVAKDPIVDVDRIYDTCRACGENCLFVYYAPPHRMVLGAHCPTVPVIAWEFPNIPSVAWDDDARNDWRYVLAKTAGAITLSKFAATAVRTAMGDRYPVLAAPAPVWDRSPTAGAKASVRPPQQAVVLEFQGVLFDSRNQVFKLGEPPPQPPKHDLSEKHRVTLDGVVFTSVFAPKDGRKNWQEMLTAFVAAFRDQPDATLVYKMIGRDISYWWWELHDLLTRMPAFRCRVLVLQGYLSDAHYAQLVAATHWVLNASTCEGLCLPLLEFMCAGRPAVAPAHTAMADYIRPSNAMVVRSDDDYCGWPQDPRRHFTTLRKSVDWLSLRDSLREAYRVTKSDEGRYAAYCDAAIATMRQFCADDVVLHTLADFLGLQPMASATASTISSA
jgi:glycosyltransferase involved in cell wall biosynthesis